VASVGEYRHVDACGGEQRGEGIGELRIDAAGGLELPPVDF
jgi:hypothetical protein